MLFLMKIIQVHNYYQQAGGEDAVVAAEKQMLRRAGHEVISYYVNNDEIQGCLSLISSSLKTLWNFKTYSEFRKLIRKEQPDVVHCHNTFPLISPSIYWVCVKEKVPVVQTLHNYRLLCLNSQLFRHNEGKAGVLCEKCIARTFKMPGIVRRCYRESLPGSLVVALMLCIHKYMGTWTRKVTTYISLTEFQKQKMVEGGIPEHKIAVKPNFLDSNLYADPSTKKSTEGVTADEGYAVFVGRLSPEKGCRILIRAWEKLLEKSKNDLGSFQLMIVGDGPELKQLQLQCSKLSEKYGRTGVCFLGKKPKQEVLQLIKGASFMVLPSLWYEGFPMTIVEAFHCSTCVIASALGSMNRIIRPNENGVLFEPGNAEDLASKIHGAIMRPEDSREMGRKAGLEFEELYSDIANFEVLMNIYQHSIKRQKIEKREL